MNRAVTLIHCFSAVLAHAQDDPPVTINVPVSVNNMHPDVTHLMVVCDIFDEQNRPVVAGLGNDVRADDSFLVDGAFEGTLKVDGGNRFTSTDDAHRYVCALWFGIRDVPGSHYPGPPPPGHRAYSPRTDAEAAYIAERMRHDESAPFRYIVEGTF